MPKQIKKVSLKKIVELILSTDREVFKVRFLKRSTGEVRTMLAMRGVTEHLKGGELPYEAAEKALITVFDTEKEAYRSISAEGIIDVKIGNTTYKNKDYIG